LTGYAAVLIVVGQVLAVLGVILVVYFTIRQRLQERVQPGKKPGRRGIPYPDLHYWHVLRQRHPLGRRVRQAILKGKTPGI